MKTLFVFNHPAPYKVHVFNKLSKLADIQVIFERTAASDRPESFYSENHYNFPVIFLKRGAFGRENTSSGELKKYIKEHHQEYDTIVMNGYSTIAEMKAIRFMIKNKIPYVLQINGGVIKKDNPIKKKLKTYFISHAAKYFSPCSEADKYLIHYGAKKANIFHYPYGNYFKKDVLERPLTQEEKNNLRLKWHLPIGTLFVNASQFIERKNNIQLISLFKERDESLLLIGAGSQKEEYEQYIKEHEINNVMLMDFMEKKDLFEILSACDCFVTLSFEDIFGHTTLEALANGIPVISSNRVVSSLDIITDGENGFIVDLNKENQIKKALDNALTLDVNKAIESAKNNTIEMTAHRLKELIEQ